jgi:hypothetical protein
MFYWLSNNNLTGQGDKTEGLEREGLYIDGKIGEGEIGEGVCKEITFCFSPQ